MFSFDTVATAVPVLMGLLFVALFVWSLRTMGADRPELWLAATLYATVTLVAYTLFSELAAGYRVLAVARASATVQRQAAYIMGRAALTNHFTAEEACINLATGAVRDRFNHPDCAVGNSGVNLRFGTPTAEEQSLAVLLSREENAARFHYRFDGEYAEMRLDNRPQCAVRYAPAPLKGMPPLVSYDVGGC